MCVSRVTLGLLGVSWSTSNLDTLFEARTRTVDSEPVDETIPKAAIFHHNRLLEMP